MRLLRDQPEELVKLLWYAMFPFALAGVVLGSGPLIAGSGVVISLVGVLLVTDFNGVLERITERYRGRWRFRRRRMTRFDGGVCLVIGIGWIVFGVALSVAG